MTLSDLYKEKIAMVAILMQRATTSSDWEARNSFRSSAWRCQQAAGYLAHCIVLFGDKNTDELQIKKLRRKAIGMACTQENPWTRGLAVIGDF